MVNRLIMDVLMRSKSLTCVRDKLTEIPGHSLLFMASDCMNQFMLANFAGIIGNYYHII
ncbi:unnamed protein product [Thelazia callipaeda]|uniref:Uncharacterized protein n=1 Tax=Thelazia callipaeda TaxID=103827 RepID=A0A0N5CK87_THECL|nr:unnamed protein product [Thelazia callipaeda]